MNFFPPTVTPLLAFKNVSPVSRVSQLDATAVVVSIANLNKSPWQSMQIRFVAWLRVFVCRRVFVCTSHHIKQQEIQLKDVTAVFGGLNAEIFVGSTAGWLVRNGSRLIDFIVVVFFPYQPG